MTSTAIIDGVLYAINNGADVINLSLGLQLDPSVALFPESFQESLIRYHFLAEEAFWGRIFGIAEDRGATIVLAAGNQNILTGVDPLQRSPLGIKVNAVDVVGNKAPFSNHGYNSTISAPGVGIMSTVPGANWKVMDGTSMAAPLVAGAVGLIKSIERDISTPDIIDLLRKTGRPANAGSSVIGPILQLKDLLCTLENDCTPGRSEQDVCENTRREIDRLQQRINDLLRQCPELDVPQDTLEMPDKIEDLSFLDGRWKSTTPLTNDNDEQVTLYFTFHDQKNSSLDLYEPNDDRFTANLTLDYTERELIIDQLEAATSLQTRKFYARYKFTCTRASSGFAICVARNKDNRQPLFNFNLVKMSAL
jgi:hypothetical protein